MGDSEVESLYQLPGQSVLHASAIFLSHIETLSYFEPIFQV